MIRDTHERPVCHRGEDLVSYLYGEMSGTDALDFHNHLQNCDACRSEFALFNQVHNSIQLWRHEALGASFNPAAAAAEPAIDSTQFVRHERRLSAVAALREFFSVSPLWLRGATAFAALLLLVLGIMMIARAPRRPVEIATGEKLYTRQELNAAVKTAVEQKAAELTAQQQSSVPAPKRNNPTPGRGAVAANRQPKSLRPRALNRQEREQLAADLRLTSPADEEELLPALPEQEKPNQ